MDDIRETVNYTPEVEEALDLDEHVLLVVRKSGRGSRSGVPVTQRLVVLWTFEGNRILSESSFRTKQEALEAAGLSE
jgi:ketosteroid isomerase-like protein